MSWADVCDDPAGTRSALIPFNAERFIVEPIVDPKSPALAAVTGAIATLAEREYRLGDRDRYSLRVITRFARLHGLTCRAEVLDPMTPGDDLEVLLLHPRDAAASEGMRLCNANPFIDDFRTYWAGEVYCAEIALSSPLGGQQLHAGMNAVFGEKAVLDEIGVVLRGFVDSVRASVRAAREPELTASAAAALAIPGPLPTAETAIAAPGHNPAAASTAATVGAGG
ncbi:hypothetical protein ACIGO9_29640 [Nocardia asteroides]|uniref:hypothetical protein n=1 Tax=Nocardia asteroides TaxID=1824 RepID=UPI0037C91471